MRVKEDFVSESLKKEYRGSNVNVYHFSFFFAMLIAVKPRGCSLREKRLKISKNL